MPVHILSTDRFNSNFYFFPVAVFHRNHMHITGLHLVWIRVWAIMLKRWILSRRQMFTQLAFFLCPLVIEILIVATLPNPQSIQASLLQNERVYGAHALLIPAIYDKQTIVIHSNSNNDQVKIQLSNYLTHMGATIDEISINDVSNYVLSRSNDSYDTYVNKYQLGFSIINDFSSTMINVFFSTVNYHAMATGLSAATTSLFRNYANSSSKTIQTINQPIFTSSKLVTGRAIFFDYIYCFDTIPFSLLNFINSIIASIFISILALNVIRERISHSKDLQLLTNTSKRLYWLSNSLYDFTSCLILSVLLTIVVKVGHATSKTIDTCVVYASSENISQNSLNSFEVNSNRVKFCGFSRTAMLTVVSPF